MAAGGWEGTQNRDREERERDREWEEREKREEKWEKSDDPSGFDESFVWVQMEHRKEKLSEIDRFHIIQLLKKNNVELNKKRKLQADQLCLPKPKQKCHDQSTPSVCASKFDRNLELEEKYHVSYESEPDSAKGSNSFGEESGSTVSMFESPVKPENNSDFSADSLDVMTSSSSTEETGFGSKGREHSSYYHNNEIQEFMEFGMEEDNIEHNITDRELEELLFSNGLNPNRYTLSSGRWSIDEAEAQSGPRKPTIDQEFEQYFSMLML